MFSIRIFPLLLGLTIFLSGGVSEALTCQELLTKVSLPSWTHANTEASPSFNQSSFEKIKSDIKSKIEDGNSLNLLGTQSELAKIAFFEVIAEKSGWDLLNLSKLMSNGTAHQQQRVVSLLSKFSFDEGISSHKLESILTRLYLLANSHPAEINFSVSSAKEKLIIKRMELSFLKQSFLAALYEIGLVRDPTLWERARALRLQYSNYESLLITASLNALSITHIGLPIHVPKLSAGERQPIPQQIIQKIKEQGIDAAREDLRRIYSRHSNFQLAWNTVRRIYAGAMIGFSVFMSIQMLPVIEYSIASHFTTEQRLSEIQEATFSAEKVRQEQFNSWKQAFYDIEGRYPDPNKYPQDAEEWNRVWNSLVQTPDNELKVKFDTTQ